MAGLLSKYRHNYFRIRKDSDQGTVSENELAEKTMEDPGEFRVEKIMAELEVSGTDIKVFSRALLSSIARILEISQGAFFLSQEKDQRRFIKFISGYAYHIPETEVLEFQYGEGLSGQVAKDGRMININSIPDGYVTVLSGLGKATPGSMIIFPVLADDEVLAVIELASFHEFSKEDENLIRELTTVVAEKIKNLQGVC
ncbi:MAG: GAF domain-containing protein [Bacteroidetes bacterium]|nr:GAF domain-containing protein [Bacteroidota bacterium]